MRLSERVVTFLQFFECRPEGRAEALIKKYEEELRQAREKAARVSYEYEEKVRQARAREKEKAARDRDEVKTIKRATERMQNARDVRPKHGERKEGASKLGLLELAPKILFSTKCSKPPSPVRI